MLTQAITILIIVAIVGCILYGRKLIRTEKVDAVFGNPERAKGGTHWVILGSSVILLVWMYYSWDIAKGFYPRSANELCQVAKVNDSLVALNYQFPINEREFKTTAIIKNENKNLQDVLNQIESSENLNSQEKNELTNFVNQTISLIPMLTNYDLMELETKNSIKEITGKINDLTSRFKQADYPFETAEQKAERLKLLESQGDWSLVKIRAGTGSIENTIEIPLIAETSKGLKFSKAAEELNLINDEFFKLRNHNPTFKSAITELKESIKEYRANKTDAEELASTYAKDIEKIARRIEFATIYPPTALNEMQQAIIDFDKANKAEQGGLRWVDVFLFPAGTIVASGSNCSEQGSARWLPKPSDTFNKFILMSKPSVGYKSVPLLWIDMMDVSQIIGFILPDWIADILPGDYPVHTTEGVVEQNFKGRVLKVVTGDFSLFKIPVPYGHIWDSFMRVLLGLIFGIVIGVPLGLFMGLNRFAKGFFDPLIELYRPVPPLAWAPLVISVLGIDNTGKVFLLFMVSLSIMIISARAGASGTQLSKIHAAHSLGASKRQILRYVIFPNSLPEILTGIRVAVGMCWGTLVAAEFLAGTTGIGFVENVAKKYFQYEVIWITIFIMGMLGLLFDVTLRKMIAKYIPWRGKG
ncbi:MAG: taurine ABC transporter permease [Pelagibacteraceae bacterium BACL5 MAG-120705-bin12]|jgi:taurine transport system permease protein|uniref:ABC transporter permease subunit n=1 Tax=Candidatus Pelagibacter sp. TaxID=2024849 RepID=UPI00071588B7|nr:MAG: taurine ABC transporter permease [Pelagibacteraceae bacterium BACL5 MAG-121015-bin10]KRO60552.1 MAG: taurine ABC transporter permease [Pelagibacteraceae bacterium BACL5 MAG-120705-bin12]KRO64467.1 MAG: taurine ABC transporter permease [Pelagibacteraceae bacterium BACL5 MAG-120820-bin39]